MTDQRQQQQRGDAPIVDDRTLVALTPEAMLPAQAELAAWCDQKIAAVRAELADIEANLDLATEHGWKHASVAAALNRTKKRILYYEKLKVAVAAGYVVVPNFPIDVFAVRVQRQKQPAQVKDNTRGGFPAVPELLPAGEGRYVDDQLHYRDVSLVATVDGKEREVPRYMSDDYDAVDFPVTLVKPSIMDATARAMALKVFDQLGTVTNEVGRDPIVVGQLLDPRGHGRRITFFIAWWLDTASL
jgi:hypothetical protein